MGRGQSLLRELRTAPWGARVQSFFGYGMENVKRAPHAPRFSVGYGAVAVVYPVSFET